MKTLAMTIVGIVIVGLVFIVGREAMKMPWHRETSRASVEQVSIAQETDTHKINLSYPKFSVPNADVQVQAIVDKAVADFISLPPNPTPVPAKNELDGEYRNSYVSADVLSARMDIYQFSGGAHGGTVAYGLNFHPDGTAYTLDEALAMIGKDLTQVADEANKQLTERFGMVQFPEGATPSPQNYGMFLIGSSTVTFIFQQYQVEAYAAGMPEISFLRVK